MNRKYDFLMDSRFQGNHAVEPTPYQLPIGSPALRQKQMRAMPGTLLDLRLGREVRFDQMIAALDAFSFIAVGEQHDDAQHHQFQADVVRALAKRPRPVTVGVEMFHRTNLAPLALWTLGRLSEEEFIEQSQWKTQWGFEYVLYKPIFDAVRELRLRMIGLNMPRDIVRKVGREGWNALSAEERMGVPDLDLNQNDHKRLFESLMGGHPMGAAGANIYAAQVLWDTGMADTALRYHEQQRLGRDAAFVILAGNGHVMYGQGITLRIAQRSTLPCATIVCLTANEPMVVSRTLADYLYVAAAR